MSMSQKKPTGGDLVLAEADVAEILDRAVKLDGARDGNVSVEQLREAALEVGVSPTAFDEALKEFASASQALEVPDPAPAKVTRPRFFYQIRTAVTVAVGLLVGSVAGDLVTPRQAEVIIAFAALIVAGGTLRLVLSHRKDRSVLAYVMDTFWLWTSFGIGVTLASGYLGEESIVLTITAIVIASVVGGLFVKRGEGPDPEKPRTLRLELVAPKDGNED